MTRPKLVPGSVGNDDNLLIIVVPKGGVEDPDNPTVVELTAETVKDVTYSLTADGWNTTRNQDTTTDDRLTLGDVLEQPGRKTNSLEVKYVFGTDEDVADPLFEEGFEGLAYARYAVPYTQDIASGDLFEKWPFKAGVKRVDAPAANGKWTKTQKLFVTGPVGDATVTSGS